ncbi:glutamine--tRNA ligase/YqeY domain fusion protein [Anaerobacillus alkaliphilus]|uniref:Glutamine--tRNA ligase n=1 Tax=Anaerobacillus alkaliphilus TaxID=1548597 RepID=A0A4Q0VXC9_9BACI|nr:glutamine--tRNA ligase/YqeY domain fusion protein [Anaerobacillus alkaliphilus]RXJ04407.1 glutamine--tRNA ligase/YqeY domain fusion protein [Anaerobacillus alkaliphilus]
MDNFLTKLVAEDVKEATFQRPICTRFPPEPNGYLHIGSAYAIHTNYMIAKEFKGKFNLRFDDTNPLKEDIEYVNAIIEDLEWLEYRPDNIFYGSDYSEQIFESAVRLIKKGKAYVCDLSPKEMTEYRGTLTEGGKDSPYRHRSVEENLELFLKMKNGDFANASKVLRAKIDMSSANINLRDPVLYRIIHASHYRTGNDWCIYPMYDFAHPIQDAIEGITHSLCSIEFKDHRPLYEWVLNELDLIEPPKQREFGRLNVTGVVTSKRFLRELVHGGYVDGWDDPRMPTIRGMRRRGFTPSAIRHFIEEIGLAKHQTVVDMAMLEHSVRNDLKPKAPSVMAVLEPLRVVITNYPEGQTEYLTVKNNSENPELGSREVPFSRVVYIEREDFMEVPEPGFKRLTLGTEVRLMGAYFIKCDEVVKDTNGETFELRCTYDPETKSGTGFKGRKVKGTIHWVSAEHAVKVDVHLYYKLLVEENEKESTWEEKINTNSLAIRKGVVVEPSIANALPEEKFQFLRQGYFCVDKKYTTEETLVLNRIVPLKDSWKRLS